MRAARVTLVTASKCVEEGIDHAGPCFITWTSVLLAWRAGAVLLLGHFGQVPHLHTAGHRLSVWEALLRNSRVMR